MVTAFPITVTNVSTPSISLVATNKNVPSLGKLSEVITLTLLVAPGNKITVVIRHKVMALTAKFKIVTALVPLS